MTFSNEWMRLREELLPPERGRSARDRQAASLRRWLRSCAADPSCSVAEAASRYWRTQPAEPSPEWLELREDLLGGKDAPSWDHPE